MAACAQALTIPVTTNSDTILSNAEIWPVWNVVYTASSAATITNYVICGDVWPIWVGGNTGNATTVSTTTSSAFIWAGWNVVYIPRLTEKERAEHEALQRRQRAEYEAQQREEAAQRTAIEAVARQLLLGHLTLAQREQLDKTKVFEVIGGSKKRRYQIDSNGAVVRLDEKGERVESYCIHPDFSYRLPASDLVLAKKLMLEHDEETFLKTANATRLRA